MNYLDELVVGVAEMLASEGVLVWDPAGEYPADSTQPCGFIQVMPDASYPVVTLSGYPVDAQLAPNDSVIGVQVRTRAPGTHPVPVNDLDAAVYDVLHGLCNTTLKGHRVTKILFQSGASLGQDGSERWSRSANYYITAPRHHAVRH